MLSAALKPSATRTASLCLSESGKDHADVCACVPHLHSPLLDSEVSTAPIPGLLHLVHRLAASWSTTQHGAFASGASSTAFEPWQLRWQWPRWPAARCARCRQPRTPSRVMLRRATNVSCGRGRQCGQSATTATPISHALLCVLSLTAGQLSPYGCLNEFYCNPAYGLADAGVRSAACSSSSHCVAPKPALCTSPHAPSAMPRSTGTAMCSRPTGSWRSWKPTGWPG